jgi:hypothetical protein
MAIIAEAMKVIPQVVAAIQQIMASDEAHTIESAVQDIIHHLTPGGPAAPALAPHAESLVPTAIQAAATTSQAIDFQAPKG